MSLTLAQQLDAARKPAKSPFETWIDGLDKADREALMDAAPDASISNAKILEIVNHAEPPARAGKDTIAAWRKANGLHR